MAANANPPGNAAAPPLVCHALSTKYTPSRAIKLRLAAVQFFGARVTKRRAHQHLIFLRFQRPGERFARFPIHHLLQNDDVGIQFFQRVGCFLELALLDFRRPTVRAAADVRSQIPCRHPQRPGQRRRDEKPRAQASASPPLSVKWSSAFTIYSAEMAMTNGADTPLRRNEIQALDLYAGRHIFPRRRKQTQLLVCRLAHFVRAGPHHLQFLRVRFFFGKRVPVTHRAHINGYLQPYLVRGEMHHIGAHSGAIFHAVAESNRLQKMQPRAFLIHLRCFDLCRVTLRRFTFAAQLNQSAHVILHAAKSLQAARQGGQVIVRTWRSKINVQFVCRAVATRSNQ